MLVWQWIHVRDDGPITRWRAWSRRRLRRVPRDRRGHRDPARVAAVGRLPATRAARSARVPRARCSSRRRHDHHDDRQRPDRRVPRARGPVDPAVRARRLRPPPRSSSQEAGIKYFVLGAFSSAIFLYGIALVYGATGTTSLTGIAEFLAQNTLFDDGHAARRVRAPARRPRLQGRGGAVPHVDARRLPGRAHAGDRLHGVGDQGRRRSPRCCACSSVAFPLYRTRLAAGDLGARRADARRSAASAPLVQTDVKRMLAYSSIAHAGYVLIGLQAATARGRAASLFYLLVYTFMVDRRVRGGRR